MAEATPLARVVFVAADGTQLDTLIMSSSGGLPDLTIVESLARLQLAARRAGGHTRLEEVSASLEELLDLAGLLREVSGQVEDREQVLRIQEGVDPRDEPA